MRLFRRKKKAEKKVLQRDIDTAIQEEEIMELRRKLKESAERVGFKDEPSSDYIKRRVRAKRIPGVGRYGTTAY